MKKVAILFLLCITSAFAQEKKYQSLLWEVSGNGLTKKSYLYGSMHVSDKISYHLSDAFFTHLLNADIVANESEPSTWADLFGMFMPGNNQYNPQFYAGFHQKPVTKAELYSLFKSNNFTLNNLLFRTNEYNKEYQEETYLDMFIYRTGRKYNKKTAGLEDTKKSIINIVNASVNYKPKEENRAAIQKILKNNGYDETLMNFYRDKDLDMIDSLTTLSTSESYLKAMLYDRNKVMVKSIDSLAGLGSLFAVVGAAHLPGKKGIIEMLRAKGYTVTPIFDAYTEKGKAKKQQIEEYFLKPAFKKHSTPDGIIQLPLFNSVIENNEDIESPDLTNGGYVNVKRLLLLDYLKKNNKPFDHKSLDSLFYENIPGNIIDKRLYQENGYTVYDIKNITKTGNAQRYKYYITPLEVITVTMAGEGNYARRFEDEVYGNISLKPVTDEWVNIAPKRGGFSAYMPEYTVIYGDRDKAAFVPDIEMYSYDSKEKANYFILERTLHDKTLENTEYELKRIHYEFYSQFDIDSTQTIMLKNPLSYSSSSSIGSKAIALKTVINGSKYYLLGTVGASGDNTERFYNSFRLRPYASQEEYRAFTDSTSHFTIEIPKKQNEKLDFVMNRPMLGFGDPDKVNHFQEQFHEYAFSMPSGETVDLASYQYHRYENLKPLDTLWNDFRLMVTGKEGLENNGDLAGSASYITTDAANGMTPNKWDNYVSNSSKGKIRITNEKISYNEAKKYHQIELTAVSDKSEQVIKYRGIYRNGQTYVLSALVNKDYINNNPYLEKAFNSFTPIDRPAAENLPEDRLDLFIEDAQSKHDSIRYSALASIHEIKVNGQNAHKLIHFLKNYDFKAAEANIKVSLYRKLGFITSPYVVAFLEQEYKKDNSNTIIQFAVLNALTLQKSKEAYRKIMELLEHDLPVSDNAYDVNSLFSSFEEDTEHSAVLFPEILQFYSIKEYQQPIVDFTAVSLNSKSIRLKKLNSYKKMILTNAKLELKRVKSRKTSREAEEEYDVYYSADSQVNDLIGYINLLYPYSSDKAVKSFFHDCRILGIDELELELARLDIRNKKIEKASIESLLGKPETLHTVVNMLITAKNDDFITAVTEADIAQSALITAGNIKTAKTAVSFIRQKAVRHNEYDIKFFFYKLEAKETESYLGKNERMAAVAFVTKESKINALAYKYIEPVSITTEDDTAKIMETIIDKTFNGHNSRATFGKNEYDYNEMLSEYGGY